LWSNLLYVSLKGEKRHKGLTDILAGEEVSLFTLNERNKLHFLPCRTSKHGDSTILHSAQFSDAIQLFQQKFDMIIFLAPPVIGRFETQLISLKTDGLVMAIDAGKTRQPVAKRAMEELHNGGVKVLGTILNGRKVDAIKLVSGISDRLEVFAPMASYEVSYLSIEPRKECLN